MLLSRRGAWTAGSTSRDRVTHSCRCTASGATLSALEAVPGSPPLGHRASEAVRLAPGAAWRHIPKQWLAPVLPRCPCAAPCGSLTALQSLTDIRLPHTVNDRQNSIHRDEVDTPHSGLGREQWCRECGINDLGKREAPPSRQACQGVGIDAAKPGRASRGWDDQPATLPALS